MKALCVALAIAEFCCTVVLLYSKSHSMHDLIYHRSEGGRLPSVGKRTLLAILAFTSK
jgi:hypothetical protein